MTRPTRPASGLLPVLLPIVTSRLKLVQFNEEHVSERYVAWLNDPLVVKYSDQRFKKHTPLTCLSYLRSFEGTFNVLLAVLAEPVDPPYIGTLTAYVDEEHLVADIGILIGERTAWNRGFASEAIGGLTVSLFQAGVRKVTAGTLSVNLGMINVMRKAGMTPDGCRRGQCLFDGAPCDVLYSAAFAPALARRDL